MKKDIILELLKQYQKQYRIALELERITEELEQAVRGNDHVSLHLILDMRQQSIEQMQDNREAVSRYLNSLDMSQCRDAEALLRKPDKFQPENREEKKLCETAENIKTALRKVIVIDKRINIKIAEKKSFYYEDME